MKRIVVGALALLISMTALHADVKVNFNIKDQSISEEITSDQVYVVLSQANAGGDKVDLLALLLEEEGTRSAKLRFVVASGQPGSEDVTQEEYVFELDYDAAPKTITLDGSVGEISFECSVSRAKKN